MNHRTQGLGRIVVGIAAAMLVVIARPAEAQLALPSVQLPDLPLHALPQTLSSLDATQPLTELAQLRVLRVRALIRGNRREIDTDRNGAAVVRGQVLALAPSDTALAASHGAGFEVIEDRVLPGLALHMVVLRAPEKMSTRAALEKLRALDPAGSYDFNHVFDAGGAVMGDEVPRSPAEAHAAADSGALADKRTSARPRVGLIDGGIDAAHPAFSDSLIHTWGCGGHLVPSEHGTAVASILVGDAASFAGVLRKGELFAADVYCGRATGGAVDAIVIALAWMAEQRVGVINMSLVGPRNLLLERAVQSAIGRGHIIVAAVGNDGPAAPPLYPAAYADVIGVTAVDDHAKVLLEACRGPQVSFAAPGAQMSGAAPGGIYRSLRGTSFAAPIVAGLLAMNFAGPDPAGARSDISTLVGQAIDLGAPGKDTVYGNGLVGARYRVAPPVARPH